MEVTRGSRHLPAGSRTLTMAEDAGEADALVEAVQRARQVEPGCTAKRAHELLALDGVSTSLAQVKKACSRATNGVVLCKPSPRPKQAAKEVVPSAVARTACAAQVNSTSALWCATASTPTATASPGLEPLDSAAAAAAATAALPAREVQRLASSESLSLVRADNATGYEGVSFEPARCAELARPFRARRILEGGATKHLGYFSSALEAALGYARALGSKSSRTAAAEAAQRLPAEPSPAGAARKRKRKKSTARSNEDDIASSVLDSLANATP